MMAQKSSDRHLQEEDKALGIERFVSGLAVPPKELGGSSTEDLSGCTVMVPVHRIMDRSPYTILEDMPAPRFYPLFIKAGVSAAAVVSKSGDFLGVLTRGNLISQTRESQMPEPQRKQTAESLTSGMKQQVSSFSDGNLSAVAEDDRESTIRGLRAKISKLEAD